MEENTRIERLADVLRNHGDRILNGTSKMILSADLLQLLNDSFDILINDDGDDGPQTMMMKMHGSSSFNVLTGPGGRSASSETLVADRMFLHDFVQFTRRLKVTADVAAEAEGGGRRQSLVHLDRFKDLQMLELCKIDVVGVVVGLKRLRCKLQQLNCSRSICELSDVLQRCGADNMNIPGANWLNLKEANFSHNGLRSIDESIALAPQLRVLDLSHNVIQDAKPLNCLDNLKHLNLGYNKLTAVPSFGGQLCNRLQILILRNNFIEDLNGVSSLLNLSELDLSENCLIEHKSLVPLANLATLQWLNLSGNPLSFHPQHRAKTASCLHLNTATVRFVFDGRGLSKTERKLVGSLHPRRIPTSTSIRKTAVDGERDGSRPRKTATARNATIMPGASEGMIDGEHEEQRDIVGNESLASVSSLVTSFEHLETKKQIEQLREQYGEKWLYDQAGSLVQDVLGMDKLSFPKMSTPYGSADILIKADLMHPQRDGGLLYGRQSTSARAADKSSNCSTKIETSAEVYVSAEEGNLLYETADDETQNLEKDEENDDDYPDDDDEEEDLGEGEESLYLVTIKGQSDPVFVIVTSTHIIERESDNGKERGRWQSETVLHCERLGDDCLQVHFDTYKSDGKQRQYIFEDLEELQRLQDTLNTIIENKPPEELNLYKCMNCNNQFGVNKTLDTYNDKKMACPLCRSTLVFEDEPSSN